MRTIDADQLREYWLYNCLNEKIYDTNDVLESIDEQPDVDPESLRPTANWTAEFVSEVYGPEAAYGSRGDYVCGYYCSHCKNEAILDESGNYFTPEFCPKCGAKMLNAKLVSNQDEQQEMTKKEADQFAGHLNTAIREAFSTGLPARLIDEIFPPFDGEDILRMVHAKEVTENESL